MGRAVIFVPVKQSRCPFYPAKEWLSRTIFNPLFLTQPPSNPHFVIPRAAQTYTFAMHKPWEENKKDLRRQEDRDKYGQDHKKKMKLKPVEKDKYRVRPYDKFNNEEEE